LDIKIVIAVNKKDVWFCKICIASIRYFYPDVAIFLLKDELNGKFSTKEIEAHWKVNLIEFSLKKFGWSAAKMHFYCDDRFADQKFLVMDSDIVFIGKLLDQQFVTDFSSDVIVSEEIHSDFEAKWFNETYYTYKTIQSFDPEFKYPGYTFNCGQLFCKGNFLEKETVTSYFDFNGIPSWKRADIFPLVDQSLFNYLLPTLSKKGNLRIGRENYMLWSENQKLVKEILISDIVKGEKYPYLIHWAGALRTPLLNKMTRSDILIFFEDYYYQRIKGRFFVKRIRKLKPFFIGQLKIVYRILKNHRKK